MCFCTYFIVYSYYSNFMEHVMFRMYLVHRFFFLCLYKFCIGSVIVLFMRAWIQVHLRIKALRVGYGSIYTHELIF